MGGPYSGKTTVFKLLTAAWKDSEAAPKVVETDEERKKMPGWAPELWTAWRQDHPLHKKWQRVNRALYDTVLVPAFKAGGIVLDHNRRPEVPNERLVVLRPPDARLAEKQAADLNSRGTDAFSRIQAAKHYYGQESNRPDHVRPFKTCTKATECVDFLLTDYQATKAKKGSIMAGDIKFWGVIKDGSKTYAVVGPDGSVDAARKALGTVAAIEQKCDTAPLPLAPLQGEPATKAGAQNEEHKPEDVDAGGQSVDAARGLLKKDKVAGDKNNASRWMTVRAPAK